jgi:ribokinase
MLNIGSVNIDRVYAVDHFARPGETVASSRHDIFAGGKGFNQSIALARAGARVQHAGRIGADGAWLRTRLEDEGVDTTHLTAATTGTGHAVIQVTPSGENAIVLHGGANLELNELDVERALAAGTAGDWLLLQNETSAVAAALRQGRRHGRRIAFNPAPMSQAVRDYPLHEVDLLILNETEAAELTGAAEPDRVRATLAAAYPRAAVVLTLGRAGAVYADTTRQLHQPGLTVTARDTTAAGDTFIGFFLAELTRSGDPARALHLGCCAAALCVTRVGAADSIPTLAATRAAAKRKPACCTP